MTVHYFLPCTCGHKNKVVAAQAGQKVRCTCGTTLDVPPMRRLSHLEHVDAAAQAPAAGRPRWNLRWGLVFLGGVILIPSLAFCGYLYSQGLSVDLSPYRRQVEEWPVDRAWVLWRQFEAHGLYKGDTDNSASLRKQQESIRSSLYIGLGLAAVGAALVALPLLLPGPSPAGRRR
jgi:hypothetical protein